MASELRPFNFKGELSATDLVAIFTASSLVASTAYNFGFFSPIEWSYVALLTIPDLLLGTLFTFVPLSVFSLAVLIGVSRRNNRSLEKEREGNRTKIGKFSKDFIFWTANIIVFIVVPALVFLINRSSFYIVLNINILCAVVLVISLWIIRNPRNENIMIAFCASISIIPFFLGMLAVFALSDLERRPAMISLNDDTRMSAIIVRTTSAYIFLRESGTLHAIRLDSVSDIQTFDPGQNEDG